MRLSARRLCGLCAEIAETVRTVRRECADMRPRGRSLQRQCGHAASRPLLAPSMRTCGLEAALSTDCADSAISLRTVRTVRSLCVPCGQCGLYALCTDCADCAVCTLSPLPVCTVCAPSPLPVCTVCGSRPPSRCAVCVWQPPLSRTLSSVSWEGASYPMSGLEVSNPYEQALRDRTPLCSRGRCAQVAAPSALCSAVVRPLAASPADANRYFADHILS